jgi:hypothetical protein
VEKVQAWVIQVGPSVPQKDTHIDRCQTEHRKTYPHTIKLVGIVSASAQSATYRVQYVPACIDMYTLPIMSSLNMLLESDHRKSYATVLALVGHRSLPGSFGQSGAGQCTLPQKHIPRILPGNAIRHVWFCGWHQCGRRFGA